MPKNFKSNEKREKREKRPHEDHSPIYTQLMIIYTTFKMNQIANSKYTNDMNMNLKLMALNSEISSNMYQQQQNGMGEYKHSVISM